MARSGMRRSTSDTETVDFTGNDNSKTNSKIVTHPQKPKVRKNVTVDVCLYGEGGGPRTYIKTTLKSHGNTLKYASIAEIETEDIDADSSASSLNVADVFTTEQPIELNEVNSTDDPKTKSSTKDYPDGLDDSVEKPYWELSGSNLADSLFETEKKETNDQDKTITPPLSPQSENPPPKPTKPPASYLQDAYRVEDISALRDKRSRADTKTQVPNLLDELEKSQCLTTRWDIRDNLKKKAENHNIDLHELRRLASQGIPDEGSHRAVAWRVLLGYLPPETSKWEEVLHRDRTLYRTLISELFVQPSHKGNDEKEAEGKQLRGKGMEHDGKSILDNESKIDTIDENLQDIQSDKQNGKVDATKSKGESAPDNCEGMEYLSEATKLSYKHREKELNRTLSDKQRKQRNNKSVFNDSVSFFDTTHLDNRNKATTTAADFYNEKEVTESENCENSKDKSDEKQSLRHRLASADTEHDAIQERKRMTSKNYKANLVGKDAPVPVHTFEDDGNLVPARIREQWKQSGRDSGILQNIEGHDSTSGHMNKLLVVDDAGYIHDGNRKDRITVNDNPLSVDNNSKWAQFFENASLLDEIRKDVVRTHPDLQFFLEPENQLGQRRYAAIERILFVWAKLNKGVRYVQGMNEIVGTLYFVLANDENEDWACEAEADTYFLFNTLMVEMRDVFVPDLDDADTGIQGRIANMIALLSLHDPEVRCHLDETGIDPSFYSIRWLTTLLSREFCLPDTIRLWDSMFASTHKDNFLRYVCVTMVMIIREKLLQGDFGVCLRLLQSYPPVNVDRLLESSRSLWIYESQVTLACHKGGISLTQALATIAPPPTVVMAYGLAGGLAIDQVERLRKAGEKKLASAKGVARDASVTMATAGRGFFKGARLFDMFQSDKKKTVKRASTT